MRISFVRLSPAVLVAFATVLYAADKAKTDPATSSR